MNDNERALISFVCDGDLSRARGMAKILLAADRSEKGKAFKEKMLEKLEEKKIELPVNLKGMLEIEYPEAFRAGKFFLREEEEKIAARILSLYKVSAKLSEMKIPYLPALMLHGESGCGKSEFARYIAYKADIPFVLVRFSSLIDSYLGNTSKNITRIFQFARSFPCVLCFDEIDMVGMKRGKKDDVGEMNRVVITLMQELDSAEGNMILAGTTNRFPDLDTALVRRFPLQYEIRPLEKDEAVMFARRFFGYAGIAHEDESKWISSQEWWQERDNVPASKVVQACTEYIVNRLMEDEEKSRK